MAIPLLLCHELDHCEPLVYGVATGVTIVIMGQRQEQSNTRNLLYSFGRMLAAVAVISALESDGSPTAVNVIAHKNSAKMVSIKPVVNTIIREGCWACGFRLALLFIAQ